jgi:hypothetical protein
VDLDLMDQIMEAAVVEVEAHVIPHIMILHNLEMVEVEHRE